MHLVWPVPGSVTANSDTFHCDSQQHTPKHIGARVLRYLYNPTYACWLNSRIEDGQHWSHISENPGTPGPGEKRLLAGTMNAGEVVLEQKLSTTPKDGETKAHRVRKSLEEEELMVN